MFFMNLLHYEMHQIPIIFIYFVTFFNATIYLVFFSIAFHTTPYAPFPLNSYSSKRFVI